MLSPDVQPREQENTSLSFLCRSLKGPFTPELKSNSFLWPVDCASTHGPKASSSSIFFFFFLRVAEFSIVQYKLTSSTYKAIKDLNTSETKLKRFLLFWVFIWNTCLLFNCHVMSISVTAYPFPWGRGMLLLEPIPALSQGEGRVLPGQVASSSQGPYWWAMWGSVSCSRTLQHAAQPCPEPGFEPATFQSLVDLLYPMS